MKRWVSSLLCLVLLFSAPGAVLHVTAETLPAPYFFLETESGTLQTSRGVTVRALGGYGHTEVQPLEGGGFGIRLDRDWSGFAVGGDIFADVPDGEGAVLAVEYYIHADTADNRQLFRYQLGGTHGDGTHVDLLTWKHALVGFASALLLIPLSADAVRAARSDAEYTVQLMACPHGEGLTYIQSLRLVAPQYAAVRVDGGSFTEFEETVLCAYYPSIVGVPSHNMRHVDMEQSENLPDRPWLYRYLRVYGEEYAADETERRAVYIKLHAAEGYENATVTIDKIEREPNVFGQGATVQMVDGEGGVLVPSACFGNRLNGGGSFRFVWSEAAKVARVEVYDLETYCTNAAADPFVCAQLHTMRMENGIGTVIAGYRAPSTEEEGYSGDTLCAACGTVLKTGEAIPVAELPPPYAWLRAFDGTLQTGENTAVAPLGDSGSVAVSAIGNTGKHGIRLEADWSGFTFDGDLLSAVPEGEATVLAVTYYIDGDVGGNMFRYRLGDEVAYTDVHTVSHALVTRRTGMLLIPLSADEVAAARRAETQRLHILGCPNGAGITYVLAAYVVAPTYTAIPDVGCSYAEAEEQLLCLYGPAVLGRPSRGVVCKEYETSEHYPDRPWLYRYYAVQEKWRSTETVPYRAVYIKLYAAEGYENATIAIDKIEREAGEWGQGATVQMVNGEGGVFVSRVAFTNGLNAVGSFRFWWTEAEKVARVELYDLAYCTERMADESRAAWLHERMRAERVGVTAEGVRSPKADEEGYSGDIYCAACGLLLEEGKAVPPLGDSTLPAPYGWLETETGFTWVGDEFTVSASGVYGSDRTLPIGDTGEFGIRLEADWSGFAVTGAAFSAVPSGEYAVLAIEYYIDSDVTGQMFRYQVGNEKQVDLFSGPSHLVNRRSAVILCALSPAQLAKIVAGESLRILGCPAGAGVTYIQSVRLVSPDYAAGADVGRDRLALADVPLCEYYPDLRGRYNYGIRHADVREGYDAAGNLRRYIYFGLTRALVGSTGTKSPVVIRFVFDPNSTVADFQLDYQCARPQGLIDKEIWASRRVTVKNGVAEVFLEDACFTDGLYDIASFRIPNTAAVPAGDGLLQVDVFALADRTALRAWLDRAEAMTRGKTPDSVAAFLSVVQTAEAVCVDPWATAAAIAEAERQVAAAAKALVDCSHRYTDDRDTVCDLCGHLREVTVGLWGDVDGNGRIDSTDARLVLQYAVKKIPPMALEKPLTGTGQNGAGLNMTLADVDGSGKIDSTDARLILQYAVKKITRFPRG